MTNTRYADDILLYAKSLDELSEMLHLLIDQLALVGLEVHEGKTKILTSDASNSIDFVEIGGGIIEVLPFDKHHKYLGKHLIASPERASVELHHRILLNENGRRS